MPQATSAARTRRRAAGGFLLGMSVGVLIGLLVALGIAFYLNKAPMPFLTAKPTKADKDVAAGKPPAIAGLPQG
jgi:cell division protein FtsN